MVNRAHAVAPVVALFLAGIAGCGGPTQPIVPTPAPTPVATPTPAPLPTPTPEPTPTPCTQGLCEAPVENNAPPRRVTIRLYTVEDGSGTFIPNPNPNDPIPKGYWARLDVTAKDQDNLETNGRGSVEFFFSRPRVIEVIGGHTNQRRIRALEPAVVDCWAELDGVRSNTLTLTFK
jgi:hypothetical protein